MAEYISRNEAINAVKSLESSMPAKDNYAKGYDAALGRVLIAVRGVTPTVDVQPVKHGRWIWVKDYRDCEGDIYSQYKCNCCDFGVGGVYSVKDLTHFCGNCGARMDKS